METYRSEVRMHVFGSVPVCRSPPVTLHNGSVPSSSSGCMINDGLVTDPAAATSLHNSVEQSIRQDRTHVSIQRSKSDVRHETRAAVLQRQANRRGSNFELAFLLERGRTLDAKLFGSEDWDEDCEETSRLRSGSFDEIVSPDRMKNANGTANRILFLPIRLRQALTKRRFSNASNHSNSNIRSFPPRTPISSSLQGSTVSISGPLDSLPELTPGEMFNQNSVDTVTYAQRAKDIEAAIPWLQQEIRSLKQQDRKLFRQLLSLGTEIHRSSGMESCQSYSTSLDIDDLSTNQRRIDLIENAVNRNYIDNYTPEQTKDHATNDVTKLRDNKLVDLYTSCESFF